MIYFIAAMTRALRKEEQRRIAENQPHTLKDNLSLLFSGLILVGTIACLDLVFSLHGLVTSRIGLAAVVVSVAGGLTYAFNRRSTH